MTTQRTPGVIPAPNRLNQDFSATTANAKWVSDFTYIDTAEGWLYLAIILDLFSRKVVGWAMSAQMNTALVETALHTLAPHASAGVATDPVCGMAVEQDRAVHMEWQGTTYYFCADGCRDEFMKKQA